MNHITALAVARSIERDRLEAAQGRRRQAGRTRPPRPPRRSYFADMVRALLVGFRQKPQPSR